MLVASPRHRAFYARHFSAAARTASPADSRAASPAPQPVAVVRVSAAPATRGADVRIAIADRVPWRLPAPGVPAGWELKEFAGRADIELVRHERGVALRLRSYRASFALYRDVIVDLEQLPWLSWSWKAVRLPAAADVRRAGADDQCAQVYVAFPRWPATRTSSEVIGYVWDTTAPVGTTVASARAPNVKIVVVESGPAGAGAWRTQRRDVAADYRALFGRKPPRVGTVAVMIDSDDTRTVAEALIADLTFSRAR